MKTLITVIRRRSFYTFLEGEIQGNGRERYKENRQQSTTHRQYIT